MINRNAHERVQQYIQMMRIPRVDGDLIHYPTKLSQIISKKYPDFVQLTRIYIVKEYLREITVLPSFKVLQHVFSIAQEILPVNSWKPVFRDLSYWLEFVNTFFQKFIILLCEQPAQNWLHTTFKTSKYFYQDKLFFYFLLKFWIFLVSVWDSSSDFLDFCWIFLTFMNIFLLARLSLLRKMAQLRPVI